MRIFWKPDAEWRQYFVFSNRKLVDGTEKGGRLMRRWVDGEWQYREVTPNEAAEFLSDESW